MTTNDSSPTAGSDSDSDSEPDYDTWAEKIERLGDGPEPQPPTGKGLSGEEALEYSHRIRSGTLADLLGTSADEIEFSPERLGLTARTPEL
ncbi:hypothetical protein ACFVBP_10670 [Nocardioides sp. NPDC057764]|uniref:hypothetical protein n=1 Tax=Nocardioides sp. NPDC057764 TaxID=3346243 RepID=UPI0036723566